MCEYDTFKSDTQVRCRVEYVRTKVTLTMPDPERRELRERNRRGAGGIPSGFNADKATDSRVPLKLSTSHPAYLVREKVFPVKECRANNFFFKYLPSYLI